MAKTYTAEELQKCDKEMLAAIILSMQDQITTLNQNMEKLIEQIAAANNHRYGQKSEKMDVIDGQLNLFNEPEMLTECLYVLEPEAEDVIQPKRKKQPGKREEDLKNLPVEVIRHSVPNETLEETFGASGWKQLPDEIYKRVRVQPAVYTVEEHHVEVYAGKDNQTILKADRPKSLLRNSIVTPSLAASIMNAKYVNGMPIYRISQEFMRNDIHISKQVMANWMIQCGERYFAILYDYLHEILCSYHVIQADETPCNVAKDGRPANSKSYMWVYRTGKTYKDRPVILYAYERTRKAEHPQEFLKGFKGVVVTDGYSAYQKIDKENPDIVFAGCYAHCRRKFSDVLKGLKGKQKENAKTTVAYQALQQIAAIYHLDNSYSELPPEERLKMRQLTVKPQVEAFFAWAKQMVESNSISSEMTLKGLHYCINHEENLKVFLNDPDVPMDNNETEASLRSFCLHKHAWKVIDTIEGAKASAIIYSITETAKANGLNPFRYMEYLLTELMEHLDDTDRSFLNNLLPWSETLPDICRSSQQQ